MASSNIILVALQPCLFCFSTILPENKDFLPLKIITRRSLGITLNIWRCYSCSLGFFIKPLLVVLKLCFFIQQSIRIQQQGLINKPCTTVRLPTMDGADSSTIQFQEPDPRIRKQNKNQNLTLKTISYLIYQIKIQVIILSFT